MDHQQILALIKQADHQMMDLSDTVAKLQQQVTALMEENNQLRMANQQLHDSLVTVQDDQGEVATTASQQGVPDKTMEDKKAHPTPGKVRLHEYYQDGIHICHQFFGAHRNPEEECILCLGVLDEL